MERFDLLTMYTSNNFALVAEEVVGFDHTWVEWTYYNAEDDIIFSEKTTYHEISGKGGEYIAKLVELSGSTIDWDDSEVSEEPQTSAGESVLSAFKWVRYEANKTAEVTFSKREEKETQSSLTEKGFEVILQDANAEYKGYHSEAEMVAALEEKYQTKLEPLNVRRGYKWHYEGYFYKVFFVEKFSYWGTSYEWDRNPPVVRAEKRREHSNGLGYWFD